MVRGAGVKVTHRRLVQQVAGILVIDRGGHSFKRFLDLLCRGVAMAQRFGHVMAADAQGRAVLSGRRCRLSGAFEQST